MGDIRPRRARELFDQVLDLPPDQRDAFLAEACAGDRELEEEVRSLVTAASESEGFLDSDSVGQALAQATAGAGPADPLVGATIGEYRVIELLARGGMGAVYVAEQENPRRRVALKLIDRGIGSPELVRRFEFEAQVLGRLKHPGIAQIFQAGTAGADLGHRPFFAMELVDGLPLTLIRVCEGVQHAHQVGVIHRDLKPGNILVTEEGQPKILDFGIARSTGTDLQVTTLAQGESSLVGTLPYMSPEQVRGNPDELDTRADVYALGVLCFELLAGRPPRDLKGKSLTDAIRTIVDEEPRSLATAAGRRFPADLETIVSKALDGDRQRRYDSPSALAADLRRWLDGQPISARPQSALYQLRKLVSRNRLAAALVALLVLLAVGTTAVVGVLGQRAARQRDRANIEATTSAQVSDFLESLFLEADPEQALGESLTARDVLDRGAERIRSELEDQPAVRGRLLAILGKVYQSLGQQEEAVALLEEAVAVGRSLRSGGAEGDPSNLELALPMLARLEVARGEREAAVALGREAAELARDVHGEESTQYATSLNNLGYQLSMMRQFDEARQLVEQGLAIREKQLGPEHVDVGWSHYQLAWIFNVSGEKERALDEFDLASTIWEKALPENHPQVATVHRDYSHALREQGRFEEALVQAGKALAIQEKTLGPEHPELAQTYEDVGHLHWRTGDFTEARRCQAAAVEAHVTALGEADASVLDELFTLAHMNRLLGDADGEEAAFVRALGLAREHHSGSPELVGALARLGLFYGFQERPDEAIPLLEESVRLDRNPPEKWSDPVAVALHLLTTEPWRDGGDDSLAWRIIGETAGMLSWVRADDILLGENLIRLGRYTEAESYLRMLLPTAWHNKGTFVSWNIRWLIAHCRYQLGHWEEAEALYDEVVGADPAGLGPDIAWLHLRQAERFASVGRLDDAFPLLDAALDAGLTVEDCRKAITLNPDQGQAERLYLLRHLADHASTE